MSDGSLKPILSVACDSIAAPAGRRENQRGESLISLPSSTSLVRSMHLYSDGGNEGEWIHMASLDFLQNKGSL